MSAALVAAAGLGGTSGKAIPLELATWPEVVRIATELAASNGQPTIVKVKLHGDGRGGLRPYWELGAIGNGKHPGALAVITTEEESRK